ncbi:hypothetical protein J3E74DRAFT_230234, partial [Bipolaris maydis]
FQFGGGSRICLDKNISLLELNKVSPSIVSNYDLMFDTDKPWELYCNWFV